jgi:Ca2+-binding RTX toxin-like protein
MADLLDYAQLSGRVYFRTDENRTPIPNGWTELSWIGDDPNTGFSAGAYRKGNEVVISFTGSNESLIKDFRVANIPAAKGSGSPQILQSMTYVMQIMASNPGCVFSFTGHSLGGGLASVMAVFFDQPATIFDSAPFELSARNPKVLLEDWSKLALAGYTNAKFTEYALSMGILFTPRERQVHSYYLQGEILEPVRAIVPTISGTEEAVSIGAPSIFASINPIGAMIKMHSMTLLESVMESSSFKSGVTQQRQALEVLFDDTLYAVDLQALNGQDLLNKLLNQQLLGKGGGTSTGPLDALGLDLLRIGTTGTASTKEINLGVLAALTEYYRFLADDGSQGFIESIEGGIKLDFSSIAADSDRHGQERLLSQLNKWLDQQGEAVAIPAHVDRFIVQSGDGGVAALEGGDDKSDFNAGGSTTDQISGGRGRDTLIGLGGDDYLLGDEDNDTISDGAGDYTLIGGTGNDTYLLKSGGGSDVIRDEDGQGHIEVDGQTLNGGNKRAAGAWVPGDGQFKYGLVNNSARQQDLIIGHAGKYDRIVVQNLQGGQLGINLNDAPANTTQPSRQLAGDLQPINESGYYTYDDYGNLITTGVAEPDRADVLYGSSGDDHTAGGAANDSLKGADGNDIIDGGRGDDLISGGAGQDITNVGDGNDHIFGGGTYSGTSPEGPVRPPYVPQSDATIVGAAWSVAQKVVEIIGTVRGADNNECDRRDNQFVARTPNNKIWRLAA